MPQRPRATAHPDDHRGAPPQFRIGDHPVGIACILQRLTDRFKRQQLQGFDLWDRGGRNAVAQRIKGHFFKETAPFRIDLVGRGPVGVIVPPPIPAPGRNLFDGIDLIKDVLPVLRGVLGARQNGADPGDGDACPRTFGRIHRRHLSASRVPRGHHCRQQNRLTALTDRVMQRRNRGGGMVQTGDLPGHVNPQPDLICGRDVDELRRFGVRGQGRIAVNPL